jgi:hypothetical protein
MGDMAGRDGEIRRAKASPVGLKKEMESFAALDDRKHTMSRRESAILYIHVSCVLGSGCRLQCQDANESNQVSSNHKAGIVGSVRRPGHDTQRRLTKGASRHRMDGRRTK